MFRSKTGNTKPGNASGDRLKFQDRAVRGSRGFTLVEMVVVISMVLILLATAVSLTLSCGGDRSAHVQPEHHSS